MLLGIHVNLNLNKADRLCQRLAKILVHAKHYTWLYLCVNVEVGLKIEYGILVEAGRRVGSIVKEGRIMEQPLIDRQYGLLNHIRTLPRKMIQIHGRNNLNQFLLHELCSESCFNLLKAAYFIDNPDFNCLRGVAGFDSQHVFKTDDIWKNPDEFSKFMACCSFHNKVKDIIHEDRSDDSISRFLDEMCAALGFNEYNHCTWPMKHDNHGILVYEKANPSDTIVDDVLFDCVSLLSFCPVH